MRKEILACLLILLSLPPAAHSSVLSPLASVAKDPVKGVIKDLETTAGNLISQGEAAGNGLITHAGMELDAAARSAELGLGADLNKTVEALGTDEQNVLVSLLSMQQQIQTVTNQAYDIRDTTVIDLTSWEHAWIFAHTPDFYVQAIKGTGLLPSAGDYHLTVAAYGFEQSSDTKATLSATLNNAPVTLSEIDFTTERGNAILSIPNAALAPLFSPTDMKLANLSLHVTISRKHLFGWKSNSYDFPAHLILYPSMAASLILHVKAPVYGWVPVADIVSNNIVTQDKNGCKYCDPSCAANNALTVKVAGAHVPLVPGDEQVLNPRLECSSGSICASSAVWAIASPRTAPALQRPGRPAATLLSGIFAPASSNGSKPHPRPQPLRTT